VASQINFSSNRFYTYISLFNTLKPCLELLAHVDGRMASLRDEHLQCIQEFLDTLPTDILNKEPFKFSLHLSVALLIATEPVAYFCMMATDLKTVCSQKFLSFDRQEDLLTPPFINYMCCFPEIYDRICALLLKRNEASIREKQKEKQTTSAPIPYPAMEKEPKYIIKEDPSINIPRLRREKVRFILNTLERLGFERTGGKGSHVKLTNTEGNSIVVPHSGTPGAQLSGATASKLAHQLQNIFNKEKKERERNL